MMKKSIITYILLFFFLTPSVSFAMEKTPIELEQAMVKERIMQFLNPLATLDNQLNKLSLKKLSNLYKVQAGDQLIKIASQFEVPINQLIMANNLYDPDHLSEGQSLLIPVDYLWGIYSEKDTLEVMGSNNDVDLQEIMKANPEIYQQKPYSGQLIAIPQNLVYQRLIERANKSKVISASRSTTNIPIMTWPVLGNITSKFGYRWGQLHSGIDIWNENGYQTNIQAAYDGEIIAAGDSNNGYGKLIIIQHSNQLETYYAHLSKIFVQVGQKVKQGELLGKMGDTGNTTGIHLHFEIRYHDKPYNPIVYLK